MKLPCSFFIVVVLFALAGCATTSEVELFKTTPKKIKSVAQVLHDSNSSAMNGYLRTALMQEGLDVKPPVPEGTRVSHEVDALVSYVDMWRWDMKMYLQSISIQITDAETGDILAIGQANNAPYFHGFPDPQEVVKGLVTEMITKLRNTTK